MAQKKEKLSEIELIRQRNIAQRNEMLKKMKAAAMAAKGPQKVKRPQKVKKSRSPDIRRKQPKREYGTRSKAPKIENVSHFHSLPLCFINIITYIICFFNYIFIFQEAMDEDNECSDEENWEPIRRTGDPNENIIMPEDVTQGMMDNIIGKMEAQKYRTTISCKITISSPNSSLIQLILNYSIQLIRLIFGLTIVMCRIPKNRPKTRLFY